MVQRSLTDSAEFAGWCKHIHCWGHYNTRTGKHAGHNYYQFSKAMNLLELNPAYPKDPQTLGDYIRKHRMEQGLLIKDFAKRIGVTEDTVTNWGINGMMPRYKSSIQRISEMVLGAGRFL